MEPQQQSPALLKNVQAEIIEISVKIVLTPW